MDTTAITYTRPVDGGYAKTIATLPDGRRLAVDTQYSSVCAYGDHANDCPQINVVGGRCTCGLLDGVDVEDLVVDARRRGAFGRSGPERKTEASAPSDGDDWRSPRGLVLSEEMDRGDTMY